MELLYRYMYILDNLHLKLYELWQKMLTKYIH
jgi:hypothetical protein